MKRLFPLLLACLLLVPVAAHPQVLWEPESGVLIRGDYEPDPAIVLSGHNPGEGLVVWSDPRSGNNDFYGQLMSSSGTPLWEDGGVLLIDAPGGQVEAQGFTTDDGWVLVWLDNRGPGSSSESDALYVQSFNNAGEPQWTPPDDPPSYGLRVFPDNRPSGHLAVLPDRTGGFYVAVSQNENAEGEKEVRLFHFDLANGGLDPEWPEDGVLIGHPPYTGIRHSSYSFLKLYPDASDGALIVWSNNERRLVRRVDHNGQFVWDSIVWVYGELDIQCSDGEGGLFLARNNRIWPVPGIPEMRPRLSRILADGTLLGTEEGYSLLPWIDYDASAVAIVQSSPGTAIFSWKENEWAAPHNCQRIDGGGPPWFLWDEPVAFPAVTIGEITNGAYSDSVNGAVFIPDDAQFSHVTMNGTLFSDSDAIPFSSYTYNFGPAGGYFAMTGTLYENAGCELRYMLFDPVMQAIITPNPGTLIMQTLPGHTLLPEHEVCVIVQDGLVHYFWKDSHWREGAGLPFLQRLDLDTGASQFQPNGIPTFPGLVNDSTGGSGQSLQAKLDEEGYTFVAFTRFRGEDRPTIIAQKLAPDGTPLWGDLGSEIEGRSDDAYYFSQVENALDGEGGMFVADAYSDFAEDYHTVAVTHFDPDGNPTWSDGELDFITLATSERHLNPILMGYWPDEDTVLLSYAYWDFVYVSAMSSAGSILWTQTLADTTGHGYVCSELTESGMIVLWFDENEDLRGQSITLDGSRLWGEEGLVLSEDYDTQYLHSSKSAPGSDSFWVTWTSNFVDSVRVQRFTVDGTPVFSDPMNFPCEYSRFDVLAMEDGSAYLATVFPEQDTNHTIHLTHLGPHGEFDGTLYLLPSISTESGHIIKDLVDDGQGGAIVFWLNSLRVGGRTNHALYTQRVYLPALNSVQPPTREMPRVFSLDHVYPNPFNASATVSVTLPTPGDLNVSLFNVLGQEVMTLAHGPYTAGTHTLTVDASTLASGIYFVRADIVYGTQAAGKPSVATRKIVVLK